MSYKNNIDVGKFFKENSDSYFSIHSVYIKDFSFSSPLSPKIFSLEWKPKFNFDFQVSFFEIDRDVFEVIVDFNLICKSLESEKDFQENLIFSLRIKQAGIFSFYKFSDNEKKEILYVDIPEILFPYIREMTSSSILKGGFPHVLIPLMNFKSIYKSNVT